MKISILTLFDEMCRAVISESIIGRAKDAGILNIECVNIRDFSTDRHRRVDDYPYGGGKGMVMQAQPIYDCVKSVSEQSDLKPYVVFMSPAGRVFNQNVAKELLQKEHLILVCGHYEGIDQRIIDEIADDEISIGDFVLTGGELAALSVCDAVCRMVPGVLSESVCFEEESHFDGLLEYPQYTRPEEWNGRRVPEVLLSGHHANIEKWRREQSIEITKRKRPDLLKKTK